MAVLYIALPTFKESEGYDRTDLDLTEQQVALIQAVAKVQPKTVVVLNNGAPVAMSAWIDACAGRARRLDDGPGGRRGDCRCALWQGQPLRQTGRDLPAQARRYARRISTGRAARARCSYGEGLFIGYRYYDAKEMPVLFPFGYGLSYTTFAYSNAKVSAKTFRDVDGLTVTVDVTNTGQMAGKEIVQVYVHDREVRVWCGPKRS